MSVQHTITVEFEKVYDVDLRVSLVERLQRLYGVVSAIFDSNDRRILTVDFRNNSLSPQTLLDFLKRYGMTAAEIGKHDNS